MIRRPCAWGCKDYPSGHWTQAGERRGRKNKRGKAVALPPGFSTRFETNYLCIDVSAMDESDIIVELSDIEDVVEGVDSEVVDSVFLPHPTAARTMVSAMRATRVIAKNLRILTFTSSGPRRSGSLRLRLTSNP